MTIRKCFISLRFIK